MPSTLNLSEDAVQRLAPDDRAVQAARGLLKKASFLDLGVSPDGTWLGARCRGSGAEPYQLSVDLAEPANPAFRCSCPSNKFPCKHALGLLLLYVQSPDRFREQEPPAELKARRQKQAARARKKEEGAAPRKVNQAARAKKIEAQREGLDLLEKLVVDLAAVGGWFEATRLDKLERQAKQLSDAYLPGARHVLRQLILVGRQSDLSDEERVAYAADLIARLWATVQKGRNYLDEKRAGGESQGEADAVIEDVLGKSWQLAELREKGYRQSDLALLELAYERSDDEARQQRVEISHLVDLGGGVVYQAIAYRPFKGMRRIPEQPSYQQPLRIAEAAVYPGFLNRRVRWEKGAEQVEELKPVHLHKAYEVAQKEFKPTLDAYRQQLKHPLAPREAVVWIRCERIGWVGDSIVVEDAAGARIEAVDRRKGYSNVANLVRAAGMLGKDHPALLARLLVRPVPNTIAAEPLALLTPEHHLRLGL